jgi:acetyltransferase
MEKVFYPESIAVIGASTSEQNLSRNIIKNLLDWGFQGRIYPVGPKGGEIFGLPIRPSVRDIKGDIDFFSIFVPAERVPPVLEECGQKGIKRGLIMTAGFSEYASEKRDLEGEILGICNNYGIRFVGPNCMGIFNTTSDLCVSFAPTRKDAIPKGNIAVVSQSGTLGQLYSWHLASESLGVSKMASVGNKLTIDEVDLIPYLDKDAETDIIFLYLEDLKRGKELLEVARKCQKPIIIHKANVSEQSHQIGKSHTAALASNEEVVGAAIRQAGMVRVDCLREFLDCAKVLTLPRMWGNKVAVVSSTGGTAVTAADLCDQYGFELPPLPQELLQEIESQGRAKVIKLTNPIDLGDIYDSSVVSYTIERVAELEYIDGVVAILYYLPEMLGWNTEDTLPITQEIKELSSKLNKPITLSFSGAPGNLDKLKKMVDYPIFFSSAEAIKSLAKSRDYTRAKQVNNLA